MRAHADAAFVHVSVNEGKGAGASLPHTHAQLYALPFVPAAVARERERFTAYWDRTQGRNLLEDLLQEEVRRQERVVAIDAEGVALCPFASRVPFQVQIVPRRPKHEIEAEHLGIRIWRLAGDDQPRRNRGISCPQPLHDFQGRIAGAANGE